MRPFSAVAPALALQERWRFLRYSVAGFAIGALGSWAYLLGGSWGWIWPRPLWAKVLLFPGMFNALQFLEHVPGATVAQAEVVGIVTMGLVGAGLGWLLHWWWRRRARN